MVSVGVSKHGCTHLIFVDPGMKVNGYYREVLLSQQLLTAIRQVSGDVFQQDSAPAHRARKTINLPQREAPAFISPDLWPPNSPDLNPVDYKIWGVMQDRVYQKKVKDVNKLRERLVEVWARLHRTRLMMPSTSGADACVPAFGLEENILCICCDCISYLEDMVCDVR